MRLPSKRVQRTRSPLGVTNERSGFIAVALMLLLSLRVGAGPDETRFRLYFPALQLDRTKGERIESLRVKVSCGRFRGVTVIPNDWSLSVLSPSSEETSLKASAGHGATTLRSLDELQGTVVVSGVAESCFDIAATITSTKRAYQFGRADLVLKP